MTQQPKTYTYDEVYQSCIEYFKGDELAASSCANKYLLRNKEGKFLEKNPDDMFKNRLVPELARIEKKYPNPMSEEEIYDSLKGFENVVLQGSPMFGVGNNEQVVSISNCFTQGYVEDSYAGIMMKDQECAQVFKRRGGTSIDVSKIRPRGAKINNCAMSSDGIGIFMERFSNTTKEVAQNSRRGALMIGIHCKSMETEKFITIKQDLTKVTGANISVKFTDEFMKAVENDEEFIQQYPFDVPIEKAEIVKKVKARDIWNIFIEKAHASAEPGCFFWDTVINQSLSDCYKDVGFETVLSNPCVTKDGWVMTSEGPRKVEDLIGKEFKALVGDKSYQSGGFFKTGTKKIYNIVSKHGYSMKLTDNHKVAVSKMGKINWVKVKDLKNGDDLVIDNHTGFNWETDRTKLTEDFKYNFDEGWLVGNLLGNGAFDKHDNKRESAILCYWGDDQKAAGEYAYKALKDLGTHSKNADNGIGEDSPKTYRSIRLADLSFSVGIKSDKLINGNLEYSSYDFYRGFLRGYFDADGSVQGTNKTGFSVRLSSSTLENLEVVHRMLARLGINSKIYKNRRNSEMRLLPDGKGGKKEYLCKENHELLISKENLVKYHSLIGFQIGYKMVKLTNIVNSFKQIRKETFLTEVVNIEPVGTEDVYDCTVEDVHCFDYQGLIVHNCGELTLQSYGTCVLTAINLTNFVNNKFTKDVSFDKERFKKSIRIGLRYVDNLIDLEYEKNRKIIEKVKSDPEDEFTKMYELNLWEKVGSSLLNGRRVGLGVTGLGDMIAYMNLKYGSNEGLQFVEELFKCFHETVMDESANLAKDRGSFPVFDWNKEKDCHYNTILPKEIQDKIKKYGRRNISCTTIAPAGTISLLTQTSSGCEPVFKLSYLRSRKLVIGDEERGVKVTRTDSDGIKWTTYEVFHHGLEEWKKVTGKADPKESPYWGCEAGELDYKFRVKMQGILQKYITHSISSTCNLPKDITKEEVSDLYMLAWKSGCKGITIYRDGCRDGVLQSMDDKKKKDEPTITENHAPKRPKILPCEIHHSNVMRKSSDKSENWVFFVGILGGKPYDIFGGKKSKIELPKKYKTGWLVKNGKNKDGYSTYDLYVGAHPDEKSDEQMIVKDIASIFEFEESSYTRLISMSLRHGVPLSVLVGQLNKDENAPMFAFEKSVARILKKFIKDGCSASGACKECGSKLEYKDGCVQCMNCGWSKCG